MVPIHLTLVIFIPTMESQWGQFLGVNYSFNNIVLLKCL